MSLTGFCQQTRAAKKIVVVDLGFLGDSVHLIPALWELKGHYPEAELHTVSAPVGAEVLKLVPCVDRAWAFPLGSPSPPWWRHWDLLLALRRQRFDMAFNFSGADRTIFITALTGARYRVAHQGGRRHFWSPWLIPNWVPRRSVTLPCFEQRRQVLAACGLTLAAPRWDLKIPLEALRTAHSLVPAEAVHFSVNASTPLKEWPLTHWIELARHLLADDAALRLVATGGAVPREQARLQALDRGVQNSRLTILSPGLSIAELAAVLKRCRLHVGGDSGVLHLAVALGLSTVSLFRDYSDASAWIPQGPAHHSLRVPCECVNQRQQLCAAVGRAECLAQVAPTRVASLVQALLTNDLKPKQGP